MRSAWLITLLTAVTLGCDGTEVTCRDDGTCEVGGMCEADEHCASGVCAEGACRATCVDEDACPDGQGCRQLRVQATPLTACVDVAPVLGDLGDPCATDDECRGGICHDSACTELCVECVSGAVCTPTQLNGMTVGLCEWQASGWQYTVGPIAVTDGASPPIELPIEADVTSFVAVVRDQSVGAEHRVGVASLTAPDGAALYAGAPADRNPPAIRYNDASSILVPSRDDGPPVQEGTYVLTAGAWDIDRQRDDPFIPTSTQVFVDVFVEDAPGGVLDLILHAPDDGNRDDEFLQTAANVVSEQLHAAGIVVDVTIERISLDPPTIESSAALQEHCRTHSPPGRFGTALNVLLAEGIDFALGFTGGSPSPPGTHGLAPSCTAVDLRNDPVETGVVIAHEVGHFLGLGHTTAFNQDGSVFGTDTVSDTPECDAPSQSCPDAANLMFPTIYFDEQHSLTLGQLTVIGRNPLLFELMRPDRCQSTPTRDITVVRKASGILSAANASGSCASPRGQAAHLIRVTEPTVLDIVADDAEAIWVRSANCDDGEEVACAIGGQLAPMVGPGEYFVFVGGEVGSPYRVQVR